MIYFWKCTCMTTSNKFVMNWYDTPFKFLSNACKVFNPLLLWPPSYVFNFHGSWIKQNIRKSSVYFQMSSFRSVHADKENKKKSFTSSRFLSHSWLVHSVIDFINLVFGNIEPIIDQMPYVRPSLYNFRNFFLMNRPNLHHSLLWPYNIKIKTVFNQYIEVFYMELIGLKLYHIENNAFWNQRIYFNI